MLRTWLAMLGCALALHAETSPEDLLHAGHCKRARAVLEQRYRANPNDPETLWLLSALREEWHDLDAAETLAQKAATANPKDARYHLQLSNVLGEKAENASILHQVGLARRFRKELDIALALDPKNADALESLMRFYYEAPGIIGGDKRKAHDVAAQLVAIDPVRGCHAQAWLARQEKQPERLEDLYRKAVEARPASYEAQIALGNYYGSQKKIAEAEAAARRAVEIEPSRVGGYNLLASVFASQARWKELETLLGESGRNVADNLSPFFWAAIYCLSKSTELPRAEGYLRRYLAQEPEPTAPSHAQAHWRLGLVLEKQSRHPEAVAEWQAAVKLDPHSPAAQELKKTR